jgi:predicted negative regulator of RcsB-dependent stress response
MIRAGDALSRRGERAAARRAYRDALAREPFCLDARVRLGDLARAGGDRREAARSYRRALMLRARLIQRPGLNEYEKDLIGYPGEWERRVRGLLLDVGGAK